MPLGGGSEELVCERLSRGNRASWWIHGTQAHYFARDTEGQLLVRYDLEQATEEVLLRFKGLGGPGIAVSDDGRHIYYARTDNVDTDLMLVEDFR